MTPGTAPPRQPAAPESPESRERWLPALDQYIERKARTAALRLELAAARTAGKERRHQHRLARNRRGGAS